MTTRLVSIGNGLYCRTKSKPSFLEQYRAKQASCEHSKRDPRGMCYECGHIDVEWQLRYGTEETAEVAEYLSYKEVK